MINHTSILKKKHYINHPRKYKPLVSNSIRITLNFSCSEKPSPSFKQKNTQLKQNTTNQQKSLGSTFNRLTPPKTNMDTKMAIFQRSPPFPNHHFQVSMLVFWDVCYIYRSNPIPLGFPVGLTFVPPRFFCPKSPPRA